MVEVLTLGDTYHLRHGGQKVFGKVFSTHQVSKNEEWHYLFCSVRRGIILRDLGAYKYLLVRCPHHGISLWMQIQIFYNGLLISTQVMVDATAGGSLNNKLPKES